MRIRIEVIILVFIVFFFFFFFFLVLIRISKGIDLSMLQWLSFETPCIRRLLGN